MAFIGLEHCLGSFGIYTRTYVCNAFWWFSHVFFGYRDHLHISRSWVEIYVHFGPHFSLQTFLFSFVKLFIYYFFFKLKDTFFFLSLRSLTMG